VLLIGKGETFETLAPTGGLMFKLDELQMRYLEGPCVKAALGDVVVRTDDFRNEPRWPNYSPQVVQLGVRSGLSFPARPSRACSRPWRSLPPTTCGLADSNPSAHLARPPGR